MRAYRTPKTMTVDLTPLKNDLAGLLKDHHRGWFGKSAWFKSVDYHVYARAGLLPHPTKKGDMVQTLMLANFSVAREGQGVGSAIVRAFIEVAREHGRLFYVENASEVTAHICIRAGMTSYPNRTGDPLAAPCYYLES